MRRTLKNRDSTNFLREIRVELRVSRKGPFGTEERRLPELFLRVGDRFYNGPQKSIIDLGSAYNRFL